MDQTAPKKTRGPSRLTRQQREKAEKVDPQLVDQVYQYWCELMM